MKITDAQRALAMASCCQWKLDDCALDGAGMPTECTLRNDGNPYLTDKVRMVPGRECEWVPFDEGHSFAGPGWACSECGVELGPENAYVVEHCRCCPGCGARVIGIAEKGVG